MNWKYKALLQQILSHVPLGERLNHLLQLRVTRSYPRPESDFSSVVAIAQAHIAGLRRHSGDGSPTATWYEFGAGWDLVGPLLFYGTGVERQIVVDLTPHVRVPLVNDAIDRLAGTAQQLRLRRAPARRLGTSEPIRELREVYGIDYRAPLDARATSLPSHSVDYITSTNTLEHIPPEQIAPLLRECHRILRPEGFASFRIDYQDHFSYFDAGISPYNFLRYSDAAWAVFNPPIMFQNRLRHRDYLADLTSAGFRIVNEGREDGTREDFETLSRLPVHERFRSYTPEELAVRSSLLVLRKSP